MNYKIFVFTILSSVGFFNYHGILSEQLLRSLFYLAIFIGFAYCIFRGRSLRRMQYPRVPYYYLLFGIAFSAIMATLTHMQGIVPSVMGDCLYFLPYLFLFVFLKLDIPEKKVMDTYIVLCVISAVVYFCNVLTMPFNMFGQPILNEDISRGIIRIPVVFIELFPLLIFYSINRWFETKEKKWFVLIAFATLMIVLSVVRQVIAITGLLAVLFLFRNLSAMKKLLLIGAVGVVVVFVLPTIPIYKTMVELSEDQSDENDNEENIRIQSWRFYTYENQESVLNVIFGNGVPSVGNSIWGTSIDSEAETSGRFPHDVGWAGFFFYFGLLTTIALLALMVMAIMYPKPPEKKYLNYWLIFILITSVASAPILFYFQIINIMVCIGLVYDSSQVKVESGDGTAGSGVADTDVEASGYNPFRRYPQLSNFIGRHSSGKAND